MSLFYGWELVSVRDPSDRRWRAFCCGYNIYNNMRSCCGGSAEERDG